MPAIIRTGDVIVERFSVGGRIGSGGYGSVWMGHDKTLDRPIAIKRIDGHSTDRNDIAIAEARMVSRITNNHIVPIYDVVEHDGDILIVMEYLPEGNLHEYLRNLSQSKKWVSMSEAFRLLRGILTGLSAAHRNESGPIIHKDLKPENILLDSSLNPKLCDFGIATIGNVQRLQTAVRHIGHEGTPGYKSPEQLNGEALDVRTDLFNVGLIAFLLFGAIHPFSDPRNLFDFNEMILHPYRDLPPLKSATIPSQVEDFVFTLLKANPSERFESALSAIDELEFAEQKFDGMFTKRVLNLHDSLKTDPNPKANLEDHILSIRAVLKRQGADEEIVEDQFSIEEIATGIHVCRKSQFYLQAVFLYEHPVIDFASLRPDLMTKLDSDYEFCRRRASQMQEAQN